MGNPIKQTLCHEGAPDFPAATGSWIADAIPGKLDCMRNLSVWQKEFASSVFMSSNNNNDGGKTISDRLQKNTQADTGNENGFRSAQRKSDRSVFDGGPLYRLQSLLGLINPGRANVVGRAALAMTLCWLPLAILSVFTGHDTDSSFLQDFAAHARYLVAVPLLIIAEGVCLPRMNGLAFNFLDAGLVSEPEQARFHAVAMSTRRLLNSLWAEVVVIVLAYVTVSFAFHRLPDSTVPAWLLTANSAAPKLSPAGWWGLLVSLPVLVALLLSWLWRLCLWTRFLWSMSRLNLRLVPMHPDSAAGLGFIGYSAQAFTVVALALGSLAAGSVANGLHAGAKFQSYHFFIIGFVAGVVVIFNAPLLVFLNHLVKAWRRGTLQYGALADKFGVEFERRWFSRTAPVDETVLERPDFSAATDLFQVVDRAYAMWLLPLHTKSIMMLAAATLLPFLPIALVAAPLDVIINKLTGLLF